MSIPLPDPALLAHQLTAFLAPHLPYLVAGGAEIAKGAAVGNAGASVPHAGEKFAEQIWDKLRPKVEAKPAAQEAVADLVKTPNDADAQAALRQQIRAFA